ncbi:MAG: methyltransferase domain-containing protein [Acidimicrobiia bacterium]|nr:methyltransferase domain-containing protein [Acidimicrobiia bacterium]
MSSRATAASILGRVIRTGAYSNVLLGTLGGTPDDALIRRLVYGSLRHLPAIDQLIARASHRPLADIQPELLDLLRIGTWELQFGDGAPHAAVNEAVEAARPVAGRSGAGFVNAILRRVSRLDSPADSDDEHRLAAPPWIIERLSAAWGREEAAAFLLDSQRPAPRTVRVRPGGGPHGVPIPGIAGAAVADDPGSDAVVMDPSSVAVGLAAGISPGQWVLDLAAAPGGKTMHLADQLAGSGVLVAADAHPRRAASARRRLARAGVDVPWIVADGRRLPLRDATFDRVLLDAPCTGLGTLRRRPEIRHRLNPDAPARAGRLQQQLLESALQVVKPGGMVLYAVCTVFPEETVDVVAELNAAPPPGLPGRPAGKGWLLGPHLTGTDGMFLSCVRR